VRYDAISGHLGGATAVAVGDLNNDGVLDLIVGGHGPSYRPGGFAVLVGEANGAFKVMGVYETGSIVSIALGDFNGDGRLDLVTSGADDIYGSPLFIRLNTSCTVDPKLGIANSNGGITVFWPLTSVSYALETSTSFNPDGWTPVEQLPVYRNERWRSPCRPFKTKAISV
jgi:hypothetical protein